MIPATSTDIWHWILPNLSAAERGGKRANPKLKANFTESRLGKETVWRAGRVNTPVKAANGG